MQHDVREFIFEWNYLQLSKWFAACCCWIFIGLCYTNEQDRMLSKVDGWFRVKFLQIQLIKFEGRKQSKIQERILLEYILGKLNLLKFIFMAALCV